MSFPWYIDEPIEPARENFVYAHGTVMVIAWILLASTGILLARYGRLLRIGKSRTFCGDLIWFQAHRLILCLVTAGTLLGFFLILVKQQGEWVTVSKNGRHIFAHSVLGIIIVCCSILQPWIALFRCSADSPFRSIFNWLHRGLGYLSFLLSVPTIFLVITEPKELPMHKDGFIAILSVWSAWIIIIVASFEVVERSAQARSSTTSYSAAESRLIGSTPPAKRKINENNSRNQDSSNDAKLFLFCLHIIVTVALTIPLIVLLWEQR